GWNLEMNAVYRQPTLAALAATMTPVARAEAAFDGAGEIPASGLQQWFGQTYAGREPQAYAQRVVWQLAGTVQEDALRWALRDVARAHPAFGIRLVETSPGEWVQRFEAESAVIAFRTLSVSGEPDWNAVAAQLALEL